MVALTAPWVIIKTHLLPKTNAKNKLAYPGINQSRVLFQQLTAIYVTHQPNLKAGMNLLVHLPLVSAGMKITRKGLYTPPTTALHAKKVNGLQEVTFRAKNQIVN